MYLVSSLVRPRAQPLHLPRRPEWSQGWLPELLEGGLGPPPGVHRLIPLLSKAQTEAGSSLCMLATLGGVTSPPRTWSSSSAVNTDRDAERAAAMEARGRPEGGDK